ncbi:hypothetical protein ACLESO_26375 [Pyxidicoccus sp. 3LG]
MSALLVASCLLGSLVSGFSSVSAEESVALALLDAGAAPRRALRLVHQPGWGQRARLSVSFEVDTVLGVGPGGEVRTEYGPEVTVPLRLELPEPGAGERTEARERGAANVGTRNRFEEVPEPGADEGHPEGMGSVRLRSGVRRPEVSEPRLARGAARYRLFVGRPEVRATDEEAGESAWRLAEELGAMSGQQGELVLSATGAVVDARVDLREGASPALTSLVEAALSSDWLAMPVFPQEPVGPGARWSVARALGPGVLSVVTYELVELRGPRGRVRFQLHERRSGGSREPVAEGELRFDLRRPLPERMAVLYTARSSLALGAARRRLEVVRRTRVTLEAGVLEPLRGAE